MANQNQEDRVGRVILGASGPALAVGAMGLGENLLAMDGTSRQRLVKELLLFQLFTQRLPQQVVHHVGVSIDKLIQTFIQKW